MEKESFDLLLSFICHDLLVNEQMAKLGGGSIIPELCLYCAIRWLAGGSCLDITDIAGVSKASFHRVIWKTIVAMVDCPELEVHWPSFPNEMRDSIAGFASISFNQAINNCVGAVDGHPLRTRVPTKNEANNIRSFFSGHCQCCGINCQAVADCHSRFSYFAVAAPGVAKDRDAANHCGLSELVEDLPAGCCVMGDAAYEPTEHMVPVYQGADKNKPKCDNFNFYASQCRIRVEMAFGIMTKKWGLLNRPLTVSFRDIKWLMQAIARLHNFTINERLRMNQPDEYNPSIRTSCLPSIPHDENDDPVSLDPLFTAEEVEAFQGYSGLREAMAERVARLNLTRPAKNKIRREEEEAEDGVEGDAEVERLLAQEEDDNDNNQSVELIFNNT